MYPTIETFDTPLYQAPLILAGDTIDLQWGELPDALAPVQRIATGIIGTELFRRYRVRFDLAGGTMRLSKVETAKDANSVMGRAAIIARGHLRMERE